MILEHAEVLLAIKINTEKAITPKMYGNPFKVALKCGADIN